MTEETIDQISDEDVFNEAIAVEPKVEAEAPEKEQTEEAKADRDRDEKGRRRATHGDLPRWPPFFLVKKKGGMSLLEARTHPPFRHKRRESPSAATAADCLEHLS